MGRRVAMGILAAAVVLGASGRANAQATSSAQVNGDVITGTLVPTGGQPAFVFAFQLPPNLQANVSNLDCGPDSTANLTGGPGGSPECLFTVPQPQATFVLTGTAPWPATVPIAPSFSFDDRTYQLGDPFVAVAATPPTEATTVPPPTVTEAVPTTVSQTTAPTVTEAVPTTASQTTEPTFPPATASLPTDVLLETDKGGSSNRLPWVLLAGGGGVAIAGGVLLLRRKDDEENIVDLIFSTPDSPVPVVTTADCDQRWKEALANEAQHQAELVGALKETLVHFDAAWSNAMAPLDTYQSEYNVLLGQSSEMLGMVDAWAEERAGYEKADFAIAMVSLVVSLPSLIKSLPKLAKGLYALTRATLGLPWRIAAALRAAQLARAAEQWAAIIEAAPAVTEYAVGSSGYAGSLQAKSVVQAQAMIGEAMAAEVGADFAMVYAECGGRPGLTVSAMGDVLRKATDKLYWQVFNKRGWVIFKSEFKLPSPMEWVPTNAQALYKGVLQTVYGTTTVDPYVVLSRLVANAQIAVREGRAVSSFPTWEKDMQALQGMASDANFFTHLEHAVTDIETAGWVGMDHQDVMTVTVKCFDKSDLTILQKLLEAKGDPARLAQLLGPATTAAIQAEGGLLTWLTKMKNAGVSIPVADPYLAQFTSTGAAAAPFQAAGFGANSLVGSVGPVLPADPIDYVHLTDTFGITTHGFWGAEWHGIKGLFTSPVTTIAEVHHSTEMQNRLDDFLHEHVTDLDHLGTLLDGAIHALDQASNAIRQSRLPGQLDAKQHQLPADLDELGRIVAQCGDSEWRDAHQTQLEDLQHEVHQKLQTIEQIGLQLVEFGSAVETISDALRQARTAEGSNVLALHPQTMAKVAAARLALLGLMSGLRDAALPPGLFSPDGVLFTKQQQAELRAFEQATATPSPASSPPTTAAVPPRWPSTWDGILDSLGRPGETVITEEAAKAIAQGMLPAGTALPPVTVDGGTVTISLPGGQLHAKLIVRDGVLDVVSASEDFSDEQVKAAIGGRLAELNNRLATAGLRVTSVVGDGGDIRVTTGPR